MVAHYLLRHQCARSPMVAPEVESRNDVRFTNPTQMEISNDQNAGANGKYQ